MSIKIVGIDYSVNSPAACIITIEDDMKLSYDFIGCTRGSIKKSQEDIFQSIHHVQFDTKPKQKGKSSQEQERFKIADAMNSNSKFFAKIRELVGDDKNKTYVAIEGFSFGSRGNRLAELAGYQYILRYLLNTFIVLPENFHVYAPPTIKAFAGGGRFKKVDMLKAMKASNNEEFFKSPLGQHLQEDWDRYLIVKTKSTDVAKPVDDLVDAYYIAELLLSKLKEE